MILRHLTPFDWKFLRIVILKAKDLSKKKFIQITKGKIDPLTLLVIRVVLLLFPMDRAKVFALHCTSFKDRL